MSIAPNKSELNIVKLGNESFIKISDADEIRPFFMNIVSDSNHWMFVSSNGGISAGRKNPEFALFPYYTEDKITESSDITGSKTVFKVHDNGKTHIWEPFKSIFSHAYKTRRNIYKNLQGNKVLFEEINFDLELTFRYQWNTSNLYGFVKKAELINNSDKTKKVSVLDGIQNILPFGLSSDLQRMASNLGDAYKRTEMVSSTGMGIYSLSAMIVDKAEPSEALKANIVWSLGLEKSKYLLSSLQVNEFRKGFEVEPEYDIKGEKGAYFINSDFNLEGNKNKCWKIIANVNQTQANIVSLSEDILKNNKLEKTLEEDIELGTSRLKMLVASADGLQLTQDAYSDIRHYSNVLFNIMRGGIFDDNYVIEKEDFLEYILNANKEVFERNNKILNNLKDKVQRTELKEIVLATNDRDLLRLTIEYLPLKFSRRHGDPSRPWNYFTINTRNETTGKKILDYEGNWRDLFQNWEALAHSFPEYIDGMMFKFLNTSTFDGYNPYRVTKSGYDWETIEPDNPWSYIGYWGDHQVIYLLKFLEFADNYNPGLLQEYLNKDLFVYAAVPYIIKPYEALLENPHDTIEFDQEWNDAIEESRSKLGADGALLTTEDNDIYKVNLVEKLLAITLSKLSNFIPEAGIWMNTQRPEWNDANNALVGNGVSMVTLYYLRRFLNHFQKILIKTNLDRVNISNEMREFYHDVRDGLEKYKPLLEGNFNNEQRKTVLDHLGAAASDYRVRIYNKGFWGKKSSVSVDSLKAFIETCLAYLDHSIKANKRKNKLYHSYNIMSVKEKGIAVSHLSEMLEGQVAVLSSGVLSSGESLEVLDSLRNSQLYRKDQNSYILYPNKELPGFLKKNNIPKDKVDSSELLTKMIQDGYHQIIEKDIFENYHFNGNFRNVYDLKEALKQIDSEDYRDLIAKESKLIETIFEEVFNHRAFTGRSGTFFAYEGLGSIYWHMVSKLLLATQECFLASMKGENPETSKALANHYFNIKEGIGLHKSPALYGAFPTDPYSHTPMHRGAQQPGMTGQVKEDILSNYGELGIDIKDGRICFKPELLRKSFFTESEKKYAFFDKENNPQQLSVAAGSLCFTFCQTPIIYQISSNESVLIDLKSGSVEDMDSLELNREISQEIFNRSSNIKSVKVNIKEENLIQSWLKNDTLR
jgi:hypothetical protein